MIDTRLDDGFKASAHAALECLYVAVDRSIADDVNARVRRYIEKLEEAARGKGELIEVLEEMLRVFDVGDRPTGGICDRSKALLNRLKEPNVKS